MSKPQEHKSRLPKIEGKHVDQLRALAEELRIPPNWNYLLIGDGSGSRWPHACGFACRKYENHSFRYEILYGAFNHGTNILSETMAYVLPLLKLAADDTRQKQSTGATLVHVVTDSEYVVKLGNARLPGKSHKPLWAAIKSCQSDGVLVRFHWKERDKLPDNVMSHFVANSAREAMNSEVLLRGVAKAAKHAHQLHQKSEGPNKEPSDSG